MKHKYVLRNTVNNFYKDQAQQSCSLDFLHLYYYRKSRMFMHKQPCNGWGRLFSVTFIYLFSREKQKPVCIDFELKLLKVYLGINFLSN